MFFRNLTKFVNQSMFTHFHILLVQRASSVRLGFITDLGQFKFKNYSNK